MADYKKILYQLLNLIWIGVLVIVGYHIYENAAPVWQKIGEVRYAYLIIGMVTGVVFTFPSVWILNDYLEKYHLQKGYAVSCYLMFVPAIGKYIPGKIWVAGSFMIHAGKLGNISAQDALVFQIYYQLTGIAGTLLLLVSGYVYGHEAFYSWTYLVAAIVIIGGMFVLIIYFRGKTGGRKLDINAVSIAKHIAAITIQKILRGISLLVFLCAFTDVEHYVDVFYAYVVAMQAGVLAFFAPAGLGVTEGVYMVILSPVSGAELAILVALVSRLWSTALDFLLALTGITVRRLFLADS